MSLKHKRLMRLFLATIGVSLVTGGLSAEPAARVELVDGTAYVTRASGKRAILATGSTLEEGDAINTERESYARILFSDGARLSVRPMTTLQIARYQFVQEKPLQDNVLLRLVRGGLRTVTGWIGKRGNQDAYRLQGTTATIGIRGTEYIARSCSADCAESAGKKTSKAPPPSGVVVAARLAESRGTTYVVGNDGQRRRGAVGDPLYAGNRVDADPSGHAVLVFSDQSRLVLNSGSQYQIGIVRLNAQRPEKSSFTGDLYKGGMRMLTGVIGKQNPSGVEIRTTVGTIGIRGTNFDLTCGRTGGEARGEDPTADGALPCEQSLYAHTREGAIVMRSGQHSIQVSKGESAYIDSPGDAPRALGTTPRFMRDLPSPAPEEVVVDQRQIFGVPAYDHSTPGMYVEVKEGAISFSREGDQALLVRAGESAYAGAEPGQLYRLDSAPPLIETDAWLRELQVDPASCRM